MRLYLQNAKSELPIYHYNVPIVQKKERRKKREQQQQQTEQKKDDGLRHVDPIIGFLFLNSVVQAQ